MKTKFTLLIIFAMLFPVAAYSMDEKEKTMTDDTELLFQHPVVYGSFAPVDHSIGVRLDLPYGYVAYSALGNYRFHDASRLKDHERISIGIAYNKITAGYASHRYSVVNMVGRPPDAYLQKHSIEIGFRHAFKTLTCAVRYDVFRHEVMVDVGVGLKNLKFK